MPPSNSPAADGAVPGDRSSGSVLWPVAAIAIGCSGPVVGAWMRGPNAQSGVPVLLAAGIAWGIGLRLLDGRGATRIAGLLVLALAAIGGLVAASDNVGRAPVAVTLAGITVAYAAVVAWRPFPSWPQRQEQIAAAALVVLVAAEIAWASTRSLALTGLAFAVSLALVELQARIPAWDGAQRRILRSLFGSTPDEVRAAGRAMRRNAHLPRSASAWSLAAALAVGLVLRVVWATLMTLGRSEWYSAWNLRIADQFAHGSTPSFNGVHTNYWPPGYGATLVPVVWLTEHTSLISTVFAASLLNAAFGTLSIAFTAGLARRWFGRSARNPAAWLVAVAPGLIYTTSAAVNEPLAILLVLAAAWGATVVVQERSGPERTAGFVLVGLVVGYAVLVKDVGGVLLVVPALAIRSVDGTWRGAGRATAATLLGSLVLLAPWAIRNGVQVDHWSPTSTVSAEGVCVTKYDLDAGEYFAVGGGVAGLNPEIIEDCYRGSPFDNPDLDLPADVPPEVFRFEHPDEGAWARRANAGFARWAIRHPQHFISVVPSRLYTTAGNDRYGGWDIATQYRSVDLAGPLASQVLEDAASGWYYFVAGTAVVAVCTQRRVRRARPLLYLPFILATYTILAPYSLSRHFMLGYPILVVLASAVIAASRATDASSRPPAPATEAEG